MKSRFHVSLLAYEAIGELPGAWGPEDFRRILAALELEDLQDTEVSDLREMCSMALSELEPEEAAEVVLVHRLGQKLNRGQIEDLAHEMPDERLWESYADLHAHEDLFNVGQLLYAAFGGRFPRPEAIRLELSVTALAEEGEELLERPSEAFVVRLLAGGLEASSALRRRFADQLAGASFPEAASIVWKLEASKSGGSSRVVVLGSEYWLEALKHVREYETVAQADKTRS